MISPKPLLPLVVVLAVTACSPTPPPETAVPRVPGVPSQAQAPASAPPETNYDKALRFTRCLNDTLEAMYPGQGNKAPDPVEGKPLQTWVTVPPGIFHGQAAVNACRHLADDPAVKLGDR